MKGLTHFDSSGNAIMVDVSEKKFTSRVAIAKGKITMSQRAFKLVKTGKIGKGDVLGVARVAGIMAAKKTSEIIPMCHPLMLTKSSVEFELEEESSSIIVTATAKTLGQTGVEMEALTAVSAATLTIYDMCKAVDKAMVIGEICLLEKIGGKSGTYQRKDNLGKVE